MKLALYDAGANDCTIHRQIIEQLPIDLFNGDANVAVVAYTPNYRFIESFRKVAKRKWILFDYLEFGWQWPQWVRVSASDDPVMRFELAENRLGQGNIRSFGHLDSDEWQKLDEFVRDHPPALTFKRELLQTQATETMLPCEWLCEEDIPEPISKAGFDARPIEVLHTWGWSHPSRALLHAHIFRGMTNKGLTVVSQFDHIGVKSLQGRVWVTVFTPWFARVPIAVVYEAQSRSKISVSLPGAGWKCFRHAQSPLGSIMALPIDPLAWSYPWEDDINCIRMIPGEEFDHLEKETGSNLYPIYVEGQRNLANYQCRNYAQNYLLPNIQKVL